MPNSINSWRPDWVRERAIAGERERERERHYFGNGDCSIRGNLYFAISFFICCVFAMWHLENKWTALAAIAHWDFWYNFVSIFIRDSRSKIARAAEREKHGELRLPLNRKRKNKLAKGAVNPMHLRAARRQRSRRSIENKMAISRIMLSPSPAARTAPEQAGQLVCAPQKHRLFDCCPFLSFILCCCFQVPANDATSVWK